MYDRPGEENGNAKSKTLIRLQQIWNHSQLGTNFYFQT